MARQKRLAVAQAAAAKKRATAARSAAAKRAKIDAVKAKARAKKRAAELALLKQQQAHDNAVALRAQSIAAQQQDARALSNAVNGEVGAVPTVAAPALGTASAATLASSSSLLPAWLEMLGAVLLGLVALGALYILIGSRFIGPRLATGALLLVLVLLPLS